MYQQLLIVQVYIYHPCFVCSFTVIEAALFIIYIKTSFYIYFYNELYYNALMFWIGCLLFLQSVSAFGSDRLIVCFKLFKFVQLWRTWRCLETAVTRRTTLLRLLTCFDTLYILIIWPGKNSFFLPTFQSTKRKKKEKVIGKFLSKLLLAEH